MGSSQGSLHRDKSKRKRRRGVEQVVIREAGKTDVGQAADLMVRMKKLNGEFDPLFKVVRDAEGRATKYLNESIASKDCLVLVAELDKKIIGFLRAEVKNRLFYEPVKEGVITDFYILPEGRRKSLGNEILNRASKKLKQMGAAMILVEFPAQNEIAVRFYVKSGFKALVNTYAKADRA
jgi:ribosomal protein S18 acetylase RimI-like enzyme